MGLNVEMVVAQGVPLEDARRVIDPYVHERWLGNEDFHRQGPTTARQLGLPFGCIHTPADDAFEAGIREVLQRERPATAGDVVQARPTIPEVQSRRPGGVPPGDERRPPAAPGCATWSRGAGGAFSPPGAYPAGAGRAQHAIQIGCGPEHAREGRGPGCASSRAPRGCDNFGINLWLDSAIREHGPLEVIGCASSGSSGSSGAVRVGAARPRRPGGDGEQASSRLAWRAGLKPARGLSARRALPRPPGAAPAPPPAPGHPDRGRARPSSWAGPAPWPGSGSPTSLRARLVDSRRAGPDRAAGWPPQRVAGRTPPWPWAWTSAGGRCGPSCATWPGGARFELTLEPRAPCGAGGPVPGPAPEPRAYSSGGTPAPDPAAPDRRGGHGAPGGARHPALRASRGRRYAPRVALWPASSTRGLRAPTAPRGARAGALDPPGAGAWRSAWAMPVLIEDMARAAALAQARTGPPLGDRRPAFLSLGDRTQRRPDPDGDLYRGATGIVGELGHIVVREGGPRYHCGNLGCVQALASARPPGARCGGRPGGGSVVGALAGAPAIEVETVVHAAAGVGDRLASSVLRQAGHDVGRALASGANSPRPHESSSAATPPGWATSSSRRCTASWGTTSVPPTRGADAGGGGHPGGPGAGPAPPGAPSTCWWRPGPW